MLLALVVVTLEMETVGVKLKVTAAIAGFRRCRKVRSADAIRKVTRFRNSSNPIYIQMKFWKPVHHTTVRSGERPTIEAVALFFIKVLREYYDKAKKTGSSKMEANTLDSNIKLGIFWAIRCGVYLTDVREGTSPTTPWRALSYSSNHSLSDSGGRTWRKKGKREKK